MNPADLTTPKKENLGTQVAVITPGVPTHKPRDTQTPDAIQSAIKSISKFTFSPSTTSAMYSPWIPQELPSLKTKMWPFV